MKLAVFVLGREVGILEPVGRYKSVFAYHANVSPDDFVSLTMPVRTESYAWDAPLHPIFQMNLPEGYLLKVLQDEFGPQIGAEPTALLSVVGRHMIGRLQVAAPGADLASPPNRLKCAKYCKVTIPKRPLPTWFGGMPPAASPGSCPNFLKAKTPRVQSGPSTRPPSLPDSTSSRDRPIDCPSSR